MEIKEKNKDFSRIPHALIDKKILSSLTGSEVKVYLTINRFADYESGVSYPTVETISKLSGVHKGNIAPATRKLVSLGLIEKTRTSKRFSFRNLYRAIKNPKMELNIVPHNTDKCKRPYRGKDGKFKPLPSNTDNEIPSNADKDYPRNTEPDTIPPNTDKKESIRDNRKRDSRKRDSKRENKKSLKYISKETLIGLQETMGESEFINYLKKHGYDKKEISNLENGKTINH